MEIIGYTDSIAKGKKAKLFRFKAQERTHILRTAIADKAVTFSFFCKASGRNTSVLIELEGPYSKQSERVTVQTGWNRYQLSLKNSISLSPFNVYLTFGTPLEKYTDCAIAFPQCENGLYASSPILPEANIPAIGDGLLKDEPHGATRGQDFLWLNSRNFGGTITTCSSTMVFVGTPQQNTDQIMPDQFLTALSYYDTDSTKEVAIGISGKHQKKFVIIFDLYVDKSPEIVETDVIGGNLEYFICSIFDKNKFTLVINGAIAAVHEIQETSDFSRIYIASRHNDSHSALNGHVKHHRYYPTALLYPRVLDLYSELCPATRNDAFKFMTEYFKYSLSSGSELETFNNCLRSRGFNSFVRHLDHAIPAIYEQFKPGAEFIEEEIRDWVSALMRHPESVTTRETYSKIGRTDLALHLRCEQDKIVPHRIEFKIWGRSGYNSAPDQPIKYMAPEEMVGAFVMVDRRINSNIEDFENIVLGNKKYPCFSVKEVPILNSNLRYFLSFHRDQRARRLILIINILIHIPSH